MALAGRPAAAPPAAPTAGRDSEPSRSRPAPRSLIRPRPSPRRVRHRGSSAATRRVRRVGGRPRRQAVIAARAYAGVAPARPQAGVTTTCSGSRAIGKPSWRHRSSTRGGHARRRRQPATRVGTTPANSPTPASTSSPSASSPARSVGRAATGRARPPSPPAAASSRNGGTAGRSSAPPPVRRRCPRQTRSADRHRRRGTDRSVCSPLSVGTRPASTAGSDGSSSWSSTARRGQPARDVGHVRAQPLGQRRGQIPGRAVVVQHPAADRQVQAGRERPRPARLHLERSGVPVGELGQRVQVALEQVPGAAQVHPRPRAASRHAPAYRSTGRSASSPARGRSGPRPDRGRAARAGAAGRAARRRPA